AFAEGQAAPARPAAPRTAPLAGRVLLVEDHPVSRAVVTELLVSLGVEVVAVEGGAAALRAARAARFDLALVDLHMPDMDGLAVVRALRELSADARVLIFT